MVDSKVEENKKLKKNLAQLDDQYTMKVHEVEMVNRQLKDTQLQLQHKTKGESLASN